MAASNERSQITHFHEHGYLVFENLFSPEYIQAFAERIHEVAEGRVPEFPQADIEFEPDSGSGKPRTVRKLNHCAENDSVFWMHARHERILNVIELLLGPNIKLFGSQCFMKPPAGIEKPYHQDSAYFSIEPMELVTCWTALDDVTLENGCLWVIPGDHRRGLLHHTAWYVGDREDKQIPTELLDTDREVPITMPAGSCSLHHSLLPHRSTVNRTDQPRRGFAVHYMSARSRWTADDRPQPAYPLLRGREFPGCV